MVAEAGKASDVRLAVEYGGSGLFPWTDNLRMRSSGASHVLRVPASISTFGRRCDGEWLYAQYQARVNSILCPKRLCLVHLYQQRVHTQMNNSNTQQKRFSWERGSFISARALLQQKKVPNTGVSLATFPSLEGGTIPVAFRIKATAARFGAASGHH